MSLPPGGQTYSPPESERSENEAVAGATRPRRTGLIAGSAVLVAAVAAAIGVALLTRDDAAPSDEQRIDTAIRDFYDTMNTGGPAQAVTKACAQDRTDFAALPAEQRTAMDGSLFTVTLEAIDDIAITGDRAVATVRGSMTLTANPQSPQPSNAQQHLRKEDGAWKVCSADEKQ